MNKLLLTALCATAFASSLNCAQQDDKPAKPNWEVTISEILSKKDPYNTLINEAIIALAYDQKTIFDEKITQAQPLHNELVALAEELINNLSGEDIDSFEAEFTPKILEIDLSAFPIDEKGNLLPKYEHSIASMKREIASSPMKSESVFSPKKEEQCRLS